MLQLGNIASHKFHPNRHCFATMVIFYDKKFADDQPLADQTSVL